MIAAYLLSFELPPADAMPQCTRIQLQYSRCLDRRNWIFNLHGPDCSTTDSRMQEK